MMATARCRFATAIVVGAALCGWSAPRAAAEFGPIQLISKSPKEQAAFGREPALSENGAYVAFVGRLGGRTGIFREELATGSLTLVVEGAATAPSISADGEEVSFTTTQPLEPIADPTAGSSDVYLADLAASPPSYQLISAGGGQRMTGTSVAAPRVALAAGGDEVAFVNQGEVYVRRVDESQPVLVSARRDPATGAMTPEPVAGGGAYQAAGAALSADGDAVGWVGERLPEQVPLLAAEEAKLKTLETRGESYREPLLRPVPTALEPDPATRRIVGGEGLSAAPADNHEWEVVAERGVGKGWGISLPQLSADGDVVAVLGSPDEIEDLFVVDMSAGLGRVEAVRQLTSWIDPVSSPLVQRPLVEKPEYLVYAGPIRECAISADGKYVAFTTERQVFAPSPPVVITPRPTPLPTVTELYQVNLEGQTIERVTPGPGTSVSLAPGSGVDIGFGEVLGASSPSYSADGSRLAFATRAYNLVAGDANENSDVFTVESLPPAVVEPSRISSRPAAITAKSDWRLMAHAVSRPDGTVRIVATVPGAGTLRAGATSELRAGAGPRKVGSAQHRALLAGVVRLELRLPRRLRGLAERKGGLYTSLDVRFSGPGGKPLGQRLAARFRVHRAAPKGKRR